MMIIEGTILPYAEPVHLTATSGEPVVFPLDGGEYSAEVLDSLVRYAEAVHPPLLIQHQHDGFRRGEVLEVFRGNDPTTGVDSIRVKIRVDDDTIPVSLLRRFSGHFVPDATDSRGEKYPLGLIEVSAVSVPMVDSQQGDVSIAAGYFGALALTPQTDTGTVPDNGAETPAQETTMDETQLIEMLSRPAVRDAVIALTRMADAEPHAEAPVVDVVAPAAAPAAPPAAPGMPDLIEIAAAAYARGRADGRANPTQIPAQRVASGTAVPATNPDPFAKVRAGEGSYRSRLLANLPTLRG